MLLISIMNKKKRPSLLLINPWIYDFAAYDFWAKPLGFLYLSSILKNNGFNIHYVDCLDLRSPIATVKNSVSPKRKAWGTGKFIKTKVEKPEPLKSIPRKYSRYGISYEDFEEELNQISTPTAILITSAMTYWYLGVFDAIRITKSKFPNTPIILGGIYATICHSHATLHSGADVVITGPGEKEILKLISSITGQSISMFLDHRNLDALPYPAFDLLNNLPYVCIATSRGCPYRCHYCASSQLTPHYYSRSPKGVADEVEFWSKQYGVSNIAFYDDALLFQHEQLFVPFIKEILRRKICCNFHTPNGLHIRSMTEEIAHLMHAAGFKTLRFGLETADAGIMASLGEKATRKEFVLVVNWLKKAGFQKKEIGVYLLAGLPGQTAEAVETSIYFVKDCSARPYLAEYSPIPGTALWEKAVEVSSFDLGNEPLFHNNSILPCQWEKLTLDDLAYLKDLLKS